MTPLKPIIAFIVGILTLSACDNDNESGTVSPLTIILPQNIPAWQEETPEKRVMETGEDASGKTNLAWEVGDKVYLNILFNREVGSKSASAIATYTDNGWSMPQIDKPDDATRISIIASYTPNLNPFAAVNDGLWLQSTTISKNTTKLTLNNFEHQYSKFTFTELEEGDVVIFDTQQISNFFLDTNYGSSNSLALTQNLPAKRGPNGWQAEFYGHIDNSEAQSYYVLRNGLPSTAMQFDTDVSKGNGQRFRFDCWKLFSGGTSMEAMYEKERLKRWIEKVNAATDTTPCDFTLKCDIDGSGLPQVMPGYIGCVFYGTFDGAGYTISGLNKGRNFGGALFEILSSNATVKNLHFRDAEIEGGNGIICRRNNGIIVGCSVEGSIKGSKSNRYTGGIVAENNGKILGCYSLFKVDGNSGTGNIVGYNMGNVPITGCHYLNTSSTSRVAAEVYNNNYITNCYSFSNPADFYSTENGMLLQLMNNAISSYGIVWKDNSSINEYPTTK